MASAGEEYAAFVPELISRTISRHPESFAKIEPPLQETHHGVALFCDVSGFTKFSERLALKGPSGAEELGFYLNAYLEKLGRFSGIVAP